MTVIRHDLKARCTPDRIWALLSDLESVQRYARHSETHRSGGGRCRRAPDQGRARALTACHQPPSGEGILGRKGLCVFVTVMHAFMSIAPVTQLTRHVSSGSP